MSVALQRIFSTHNTKVSKCETWLAISPSYAEFQLLNSNTVSVCFQILETKTRKLEQLVRLKDAKIQALKCQLEGAGVS